VVLASGARGRWETRDDTHKAAAASGHDE